MLQKIIDSTKNLRNLVKILRAVLVGFEAFLHELHGDEKSKEVDQNGVV